MLTAQLEPLISRLRSAAALGTAAALTDGQLLARFAADRDEAAFAALVRRHGPMVLGACRRLLRDWHAAQDAFQATFLVLARKAATLREPELLARWLHGVACRTAARARADAARRRDREGRADPPRAIGPDDGLLWRELRPVLDEEIARLPQRQGAAVVLCYLEGRTNAEAGRRLGCTRGTVATLLARARQQLRRRLAGRGLALSAGWLSAAVSEPGRAAGVPLTLTGSTVSAAAAFAARGARAVGPVSARAAVLAEGVTQTMMVKKLKLVAAVLLLAGVLGAGTGLVGYRATAEEPAAAKAHPAPGAPPPEGKPAAGAVRRTAGVPGKEAVCRTDNFLVTAPSLEIAERVGRAAERARTAQALLWTGKELPPWAELCPIRVKLSEDGAAGATAFLFPETKGLVKITGMELAGHLDKILKDALPHEVTHTVLASHLGRGLPRWADEGAAIMAESAESRKRHEQQLHDLLKAGRLIPLRRLLPMRDYPPTAQEILALHVQGHSLAEFLVRTGSRQKLLALVREGQRIGWDRAVQAHFDGLTVEDLQTAWLLYVGQRLKDPMAGVEQDRRFKTAPPPAAQPAAVPDQQRPPQLPQTATSRPSGRLPVGPAPVQALAALGADGHVTVWRTMTAYVPRTSYDAGGVARTYYAPTTSFGGQRDDLQQVRVYDTRGREVEPNQFRRRLKGETPVLVATDGRPVDPLHLRLLKEDTLLLVLPVPDLPVAVPASESVAPAVPPAVEVPSPVVEPPQPVRGAVPPRGR